MRNTEYGYFESNPIGESLIDIHTSGDIRSVDWTEPGLKITRFRLLTDRDFPMYDVSYCWGVIDGEHVIVDLPFHQLNKRLWKSELIKHAKRDKVFANGIGIFDPMVVSVLC